MTLSGPALRGPAEGLYDCYDVVLASYVSAERNLAGRRFPHTMPQAEAADLSGTLGQSAKAFGFETALVAELDATSRSELAERELYSRPYLLDDASRVALSRRSRLWLAFLEGSHLGIRASRPGLDLSGAWQDVSEVDDSFAAAHGWAFDPALGYLQAEAAFCGSGLAARVTVHTPALVITGLAETAFKRALEAGFIVAGSYAAERTSALFELRLPAAYREPERAALARLEAMARAVADYERRAREQLLARNPWDALDVIGRALGRASGARLVTRDESSDIISGLRFGLAAGVLEGETLCQVTELWPALRAKIPAILEDADTIHGTPEPPEAAQRARLLRAATDGLSFTRGMHDV